MTAVVERYRKPTLHAALFCMYVLSEKLDKLKSDGQTHEVKAVLKRCLSVIDSKYKPHDFHKAVTFLWPVFTKLGYLGTDDEKEVHTLVEAKMQGIRSLNATSLTRDEHTLLIFHRAIPVKRRLVLTARKL